MGYVNPSGAGLMSVQSPLGAGRLVVSTDGIAPARKAAFWEENVARAYMPVTITLADTASFRAQMSAIRLDQITLMQCSTTAQRGHHPRSGSRDEERCLLLMNQSGRIDLEQSERAITLNADDMGIIDTRVEAAYRIEQAASTLGIHVPRHVLANQLPARSDFAALKLPRSSPLQRMATSYFTSLFGSADAVATQRDAALTRRVARHAVDFIVILLEASLADVAHAPSYRAALLRRIKDYVEDNLSDPMLGIRTVARKHRISPRYVAMLFQESGTTFGTYLRHRRLERAKIGLELTGAAYRQIAEIAAAVGFASQAHFSRTFRTSYKVTPSQYRARNGLAAAPLAQGATLRTDAALPDPEEGV